MSKNRKLRTTKLSFDDDEDEGPAAARAGGGGAAAAGADAPPPPPPPPSGKPAGSKKPSAKSLLSFGDEEEEAFVPRAKSKAKGDKEGGSGKGKFRAKLPSPAAELAPPPPQRSGAGEYTAERLRELQKNTQRLPATTLAASLEEAAALAAAEGDAAPPGAAAGGGGGGAGGIIKLSGTFKQSHAKDDRFTAPAAMQLAAPHRAAREEDEEMPLPPPPGRPPGAARGPPTAARGPTAAAAAAAAGEGAIEEEEEEDEDFQVPDEETIRKAKEKRERLRQARLAPDYIPLGGASRLLASKAGGADSGSDEEGQGGGGVGGGGGGVLNAMVEAGGSDDEEGLEERMRVAFISKQQQQPGADRRGDGAYVSTVADTEEDEAFAAEQLRKAIRKNRGGDASTSAAAAAAAGGPTGVLPAAAGATFGGGGAGGGAAGRSRLAAISGTGRAAVQAVADALARARLGQKQCGSNLSRTAGHLTAALESIEKTRADIQVAGEKYAAVQRLRSYCSDLCDCLAAKAALGEELEDHLAKMREERGRQEAAAREVDDAVLFAQGEAAVAAAVAALSRGASPSDAAAAATAAAAGAEGPAAAAAARRSRRNGGGVNGGSEEEGEESEPEVDEFGRTVALKHRHDAAAGGERRRKLVEAAVRQLEGMEAGGRLDLEEPLAGEGEVEGGGAGGSEGGSYATRRAEVLEAAATVFADAAEDYATLTAVKARLEEFKAAWPHEYGSAYVGDSAPALFAPYVRLELLRWDPLYRGDAGFDGHAWYQALFDYGVAPGGDPSSLAEDDPDANLVPQLVESLVLPQALSMVERCWDPADLTQTRAVASLAADLFVYVPADREGMAELLKELATALESAAGAAAAPPWPPAAAAASHVARAVLHLRFRRAARLLRGLNSFRELLSDQLLSRLALETLLTRQLLPALRAAAAAGGSAGGLPLAVARAEAVVPSLPSNWFYPGPPPREAAPLVEFLQSLARTLESQRAEHMQQQQQQGGAGGGGVDRAGLARRLGALLSHVGLRQRGETLAAAFGVRL